MGSPYTSDAFQPIKWLGKSCEQFRQLMATNEKLAGVFGWLLNTAGELSDAVADGVADRMTPCGVVVAYAGSVMPSNYWLPANGQNVNRNDYPKLFNRIGTQFGDGDGLTTFALPDMRNRFPIGAGDSYNIAQTTGAESATIASANIPDHYHGLGNGNSGSDDGQFIVRNWAISPSGGTEAFQINGEQSGSGGNPFPNISNGNLSTTNSLDDGAATPPTPIPTIPPALGLSFIIKVK